MTPARAARYEKAGRVGFATVHGVAADHVAEQPIHAKALQNLKRGPFRLVREDGRAPAAPHGRYRLDHARIRPGRIQQPRVVVPQELLERLGRVGRQAGPLEGSADEHRGPFSDEADDDLV